jgi:formamidopyrimidine-DNA glycosylase
MPELPEVTVYVERLERVLVGPPLARLHLAGPVLLRTVSPAPDVFVGQGLVGVARLGKQILLEYESDLFMSSISCSHVGRPPYPVTQRTIPG